MRAIHVPHSAIPAEQVGHTEGEPDAVVTSLREIPRIVCRLGLTHGPLLQVLAMQNCAVRALARGRTRTDALARNDR